VKKLLDAGAILVGKANLDQFATGLTGTRSAYGAVQNAFDPKYISGGSSSGSAVAVALGIVGFSLGTDTAGSGRVPAAFNGLVGFKPTRGLVSGAGVVPAVRSLDCVSIFALSCAEAQQVLDAIEGPDGDDPYSRSGSPVQFSPQQFKFAVPSNLEFHGDSGYAKLFAQAILTPSSSRRRSSSCASSAAFRWRSISPRSSRRARCSTDPGLRSAPRTSKRT
jgi:allophanate hydrolase